MRLTDLPGVCEKSCAADGCPFCPAKDICMNMKKASELLFRLSNNMPIYWGYDDFDTAGTVDLILKNLNYTEKTGRWIANDDGSVSCDNKLCGYQTMSPTMYCPCCGNKMEV